MTKIKSVISFFVLCALTANTFAQSINDIEDEILTILNSETGEDFALDIFDFDNLSGADIQDPYQTLQNVYLFIAKNFDGSIIGFFKNEAIVWRTNNPISYSLFNKILYSRELNNDGKVELIIGIQSGMNDYGRDLWIVSWDGLKGEILNNYDQSGYSEIYANGSVVFFPDYEADGVFEIMTYGTPDLENLTDENSTVLISKWDGREYNLDGVFLEKNLSLENLRRDALTLHVKAEILEENDNLLYNLDISNLEESVQSLDELHLDIDADFISGGTDRSRWRIFSSAYGFITWESNNVHSLIKPNTLNSKFFIRSKLPPKPTYIFGVGYNEIAPVAFLNTPINNLTKNIKQNSFSGITLGPWLPDSTLSLESFTDTLETFRLRSCEELGWANDTTVCGQLENRLTEVKAALQNQDSVLAANVLAEFIELVKAEKETSLTSEGYALLFFNAEYLAERLRGED